MQVTAGASTLPCLDQIFITPALSEVFALRKEGGVGSRQASAVEVFEEMALGALEEDRSSEGVSDRLRLWATRS